MVLSFDQTNGYIFQYMFIVEVLRTAMKLLNIGVRLTATTHVMGVDLTLQKSNALHNWMFKRDFIVIH